MKKKELEGFKKAKSGKIPVYKAGTKQRIFTLRMVVFDPNKCFIGTDMAKEYWRVSDKIGKKKMADEFCSIFAASTLVGRGRNKHFEFNSVTKGAADVIFIVPIKHRREAYKAIQEMELY